MLKITLSTFDEKDKFFEKRKFMVHSGPILSLKYIKFFVGLILYSHGLAKQSFPSKISFKPHLVKYVIDDIGTFFILVKRL